MSDDYAGRLGPVSDKRKRDHDHRVYAMSNDPDIDTVIELIKAGKIELVSKRPYIINGVTLTEFRFRPVDDNGLPRVGRGDGT